MQQQNGIFWLQNRFFLLFRIAPLFSLGCVWTNSSTRFYIYILSIGNIFFLPGVSLSSNYIPLVNEVNLQIIYYSGLGDGNGPFAGGGELKWFFAVLRG